MFVQHLIWCTHHMHDNAGTGYYKVHSVMRGNDVGTSQTWKYLWKNICFSTHHRQTRRWRVCVCSSNQILIGCCSGGGFDGTNVWNNVDVTWSECVAFKLHKFIKTYNSLTGKLTESVRFASSNNRAALNFREHTQFIRYSWATNSNPFSWQLPPRISHPAPPSPCCCVPQSRVSSSPIVVVQISFHVVQFTANVLVDKWCQSHFAASDWVVVHFHFFCRTKNFWNIFLCRPNNASQTNCDKFATPHSLPCRTSRKPDAVGMQISHFCISLATRRLLYIVFHSYGQPSDHILIYLLCFASGEAKKSNGNNIAIGLPNEQVMMMRMMMRQTAARSGEVENVF